MPLDQPRLVIETEPVAKGVAKVFNSLERSPSQELLLERPNEPLRDAVAFRGADEHRARRDPEKAEFRS